MNIYLLDTNIFSEPTKPSPDENVIRKLKQNIDYCVTRNVKDFEEIKKVSSLMVENWFEA